MNAARRLTLTVLAALCALVGACALAVAPAGAAISHKHILTFDETQDLSIFSMAVDSGHLWVTKGIEGNAAGESAVDEFDASTGARISRFPENHSSLALGLAVGHLPGKPEPQVYVSGYEGGPFVDVDSESGARTARWTGAETPAKEWGSYLFGVAVDNSTSLADWATGDVYVADERNNVVDVFHPEPGGTEPFKEKYVTQLTGTPTNAFSDPRKVAVNEANGDVVVADRYGVYLFEPTSFENYAFVRELAPPGKSSFGESDVNVDRDVNASDGEGDIYVSDRGLVYEFNSAGEFVGRIAEESFAQSLAADPVTHDVFVGSHERRENGGVNNNNGSVEAFGPNLVIPDVTTSPVSNVTPTSAALNGTVNPDGAGPAECRFAWGTTASYGELAQCSGKVEGAIPAPVSVTVTGLQPDTVYHYRLQASNANGTNTGEANQDEEFRTSGAGVAQETASDVAATSATLHASIDPNGAPTTFYFQYGTGASYGSEAPVAPGTQLGSGAGALETSVHVQGLTAGTIYHYRIVALSEVKPGEVLPFYGVDETFTTQAISAFALADGRHWELVSPPDKHGARIPAPLGGLLEAARTGDAVTYTGSAPTEEQAQGYSDVVQVLSTRGPQGWSSRDIATPHTRQTGLNIYDFSEYNAFSEDLSLGIVHPIGEFLALSPQASGQTPYLRTDYLNGNVNEPCLPSGMSCYRPLVTGCPPVGQACPSSVAEDANVPPGTPFGEENGPCPGRGTFCGPTVVGATPDLGHVFLAMTSQGVAGIYEWDAGTGKLQLVEHQVSNTTELGTHTFSNDGSRVVVRESEGQGGMFLLDTQIGEALALANEYSFEGANVDESRIFYGKGDVCEVKTSKATGKLECVVTDLTNGAGLERVVGTSEDGSYVYFVSHAALPGSGATSAGLNLYVDHYDGTAWKPTFIGALAEQDAPDFNSPPNQFARVSPDGRWLAFMSAQDLTGYDTRDAITGTPDEEVYLYDATANRLVCASCDPTDARPIAGIAPEFGGTWRSGTAFAAYLPPWTQNGDQLTAAQPRYLSDSGRLFFDSSDALVPQDVNGLPDVYEYEPVGVGSCATSSVTFGARSDGCAGLISSGTESSGASFIDASENGSDVFFVTAASLTPQDFDLAQDVYDAHECTATVPCYPQVETQPPPCVTGDSCKPAPAIQPEIFGASGSATFSGAGNVTPAASAPVKQRSLGRAQKLARALRACHLKKGRRRRACQRQAHARYAVRPARNGNPSKRGVR